ncbi:NAD-dependent aldehyde dehydrogenase [Thioflavicoccus mobilis 8321]|uniref:NAD-dependent aldehyde dehydrogenase n=1 Tax=Thioflavicoccus mobilis 8321 TaxID=765912 RepID=L0GXK5_9GAMM|nr:aldehyde dehydrogenase family protein [Thioflavicoccus mobilis]AGA90024.1 NAD-dependent aldehyde dehydrogenase [Thioflavicoccus mobilis 8321]
MLDNLIDGRWHPPYSGVYLDLFRDPAAGGLPICVARSNSDDVDEALHAAQTALWRWWDLTQEERQSLVAQIPSLIRDRRMDHWLDQCCARINGDKAVATGAVEGFRRDFVAILERTLADLPLGDSEPAIQGAPAGVSCLVVSAATSPSAGLTQVFRALIGGCTVVVAALYSTRRQAAALLPSMLCAVAGCLPAGVVNVLMGLGLEVGVSLTASRLELLGSRALRHPPSSAGPVQDASVA